ILRKGTFEVSIRTPLAHVCRDAGKTSWWSRFKGRFTTTCKSDQENPRQASQEARPTIRNDGGAPLPFGQPVAHRTPEDIILGEMTCMSNYPRSATVVAEEDGEVLEIGRNVLYMLQRHPASRELLNECYRSRSLNTYLLHLPIFRN